MSPKEKAIELSKYFISTIDVVIPNVRSISNAIKCCEQIIKLDTLTDEAWLNVPDEYKVQYWNEVISELNSMLVGNKE